MVEVQVRSPVFTKRDDGTITVDGWPERIRIDDNAIAMAIAIPGFASVVRDYVEFTVANGTAKYKIVERFPESVICDLWGCTWRQVDNATT